MNNPMQPLRASRVPSAQAFSGALRVLCAPRAPGAPRLRLAVLALACVFFLPSLAFSQSPVLPPEVLQVETAAARDGSITRYQGMETRYGLAASPVVSSNLAVLVGKVETFALEVIKFKDPATGEQRLYGTGEAHALFDVPMEAALAVVLDYPNLKAISPRVRNVKVLESSGNRILVYEDIGITFMGISIGYVLDVEVFSDTLPGGALGMRARLAKSHDSKLYASESSWYFQRVNVDGKPYTYMRTWSSSGLRNPGLGVAGIMKLFTAGELKDQIEAVAKLAAKR